MSTSVKPSRSGKPRFISGRYKERLARRAAKEEKIKFLETLLSEYEDPTKPDTEYVRDLKRRVNEQRNQLQVLSTVEPLKELYAK